MGNRINILSTKALDTTLSTLLESSRINLTSVDFIITEPVEFNTTALLAGSKHWIITSKNSLAVLFDKIPDTTLKSIQFYCVGDKTAQIIEDNGYTLVTSALSSKDLAEHILTNFNSTAFSFIAGNYRRAELPEIMNQASIQFSEFIVYQTRLTPIKVDGEFKGILFYSPSGVKSYTELNTITNEHLFCIGKTTANEAKKHSNNISIASEQSFESVLNLTKHYYA